MRQRTHAFTLVELLVVVSIIALLIAILLPSLKKARDQAKDVAGRSNLHQLGLAIHYYAADNKDRLLWIKGKKQDGSNPARYTSFPFNQYHQILHLLPYLQDLDIYQCPQAKSVRETGVRGNRPPTKGTGHPGSVTGYEQGRRYFNSGGSATTNKDGISYYNAKRADGWFYELWLKGKFPQIDDPASTMDPPYIEEIYTEYWFNDWNEGASDSQGVIPAISGNLINRIPYPEHAVMMADAVDWNPRHHGGNHFLFLDSHVTWVKEEKYFDPDGDDHVSSERTDRDPFGNYPYWCWGLGKNRH